MKINIGSLDKVIRIIAGLFVIGLGLYLQSWWGLVGVIFLFTALIGYCPIYGLFGFSTCKKGTATH